MRGRLTILSLLLIGVLQCISAAPPADLVTRINGMVAETRKTPGFARARIGIVIQSLDGNTIWYAKCPHESFIPASIVKLFTSAMALEFLGPSYTFTTELLCNDPNHAGRVQGNLILRGGGDPLLQPEDLQAMARSLASLSIPISHVTGRLILDDSAFPLSGPRWGPGWESDDLLWYYGAPSNALSCNRNALTVTVRGTDPGELSVIDLSPTNRLYTVENRVVTGAGVVTGAISLNREGYRLVIEGKVAPGATLVERISIHDPLQYMQEQMLCALAQAGIDVKGDECKSSPAPSTLIIHRSPPLAEILVPLMKDSDNHIAEQLRWTIMAKNETDTAIRLRYRRIQLTFLQQMKISLKGMQLVDGSGLSRTNRATPFGTAALLTRVASLPYFDQYLHALPVSGVDGTLQKRMLDTPAQGRVYAKTGTMRGVSGFAGYLDTASGERLVVSVLINGYTSGAKEARSLQDNIAVYLAGL